MTGANGQIDAGWVTQATLARIKGVSRQAINRRLKRFEADGLIEVDAKGRVRLDDWDRVAEETTDPTRILARAAEAAEAAEAAAPEPAAAPAPRSDNSYTREKATGARLDNEIKRIALEKERGSLVPISDVTDAMARCAEVMVREIDQLPAHADDLATAIARGGVDGGRQALKSLARNMREQLAASMQLVAESDAPRDDEVEEGAVATAATSETEEDAQ